MTTFKSMPVDGPITAYFNRTDDVHTEPHSGVDIAADAGTEVHAPAAGSVAYVSFAGTGGWSDTFGNSVILDHGDSLTLYGHLRDHPTVSGQVLEGAVLGLVGSTGESTGPHLHWGMALPSNRWFDKRNGLSELLDPLAFLVGASAPDIRSVDVGLIRIALEEAGRKLRDAHVLAGGDGDLIRGL